MYSKIVVKDYWYDVSNNVGGAPSPHVFQSSPVAEEQSLCQYTVLRDSSGSEQASHGGTKLVDISTPVLEWKTPDITIESDALLLGWGAALGTISSRGLWSEEEKTQHINMLELMGGAFATRTFTKGKQNVHVRLRMDNTTAIAYVNHMGRTKSQSLSQAACKIMAVVPSERHYSNSRAPTRIMQHIGRLRVEDAAVISGVNVGQLNLWQSTTEVGSCSIDLFASRLNNQLPRYASWHPDPFAVETDAFQMSWIREIGYAFPPFALIGRCLQKVRQEGSSLVLIAPTWSTQHWYPILLETLIDYPVLLPVDQSLLRDPFNRHYSTSPNEPAPVSRLEGIRANHSAEGISKRASTLILSGWSKGTNATYQSAWSKWHSWCVARKVNPFSCDVKFFFWISWQRCSKRGYNTVPLIRSDQQCQ